MYTPSLFLFLKGKRHPIYNRKANATQDTQDEQASSKVEIIQLVPS